MIISSVKRVWFKYFDQLFVKISCQYHRLPNLIVVELLEPVLTSACLEAIEVHHGSECCPEGALHPSPRLRALVSCANKAGMLRVEPSRYP